MFDKAGSQLTASGDKYAVTTSTTNQVSAIAGRVCRILVVSGTGSLDVYDSNAGATTTHLYSKTATAVGDNYALDCPVSSGIYVVLGASTVVNVIYR